MLTFALASSLAIKLALPAGTTYMHSPNSTPPFRRQLLDWLYTPWLDRWLVAFRWQPVPISPLVWVRSYIEPDLFGPQCTVQQYHSDLSDQSALEIRVRIKVRLKDALF